jgi:uncharacterized protein YecE (DUF72 family)
MEAMLELDLTALPPALRVGTSSFSSQDWRGVFYPESMTPRDFLGFYAGIFPSVEIDATWYALPVRATVQGWADKTPADFMFSLKVPKSITHERYLEDCAAEWTRFLRVLEPLGARRGPLLFQFPYVAKGKDPHEYETGEDFRRRLASFLPQLPDEGRYVIEVRNEKWLDERLLDLLRGRGVALALAAYFTMPSPARLLERIDPVTAPFSYVRFLGHHKQMESLLKKAHRERGKQGQWNELLVDRTAETRAWVGLIRDLLDRKLDVFAYFNNHFAGCAPESVELFLQLWRREVHDAEAAGSTPAGSTPD